MSTTGVPTWCSHGQGEHGRRRRGTAATAAAVAATGLPPLPQPPLPRGRCHYRSSHSRSHGAAATAATAIAAGPLPLPQPPLPPPRGRHRHRCRRLGAHSWCTRRMLDCSTKRTDLEIWGSSTTWRLGRAPPGCGCPGHLAAVSHLALRGRTGQPPLLLVGEATRTRGCVPH